MDATGRCPCVDGLPDPCTLCGAPADGVCGLDTVVEFEHRALRAEAQVAALDKAITEWRAGTHGPACHDELRDAHDRYKIKRSQP